VANQMSGPPWPPGRFEGKHNVRPSDEIHGPPSLYAVLIGGPRFSGSPKTKSALASPLATRRTLAATNTLIRIPFLFLFLFMIRTSKLVLFVGLLYYDQTLISGSQTMRPGQAGPVSVLLSGDKLTGCFFFRYSVFRYSVKLKASISSFILTFQSSFRLPLCLDALGESGELLKSSIGRIDTFQISLPPIPPGRKPLTRWLQKYKV
jgi:hypothetical protein